MDKMSLWVNPHPIYKDFYFSARNFAKEKKEEENFQFSVPVMTCDQNHKKLFAFQ